MAEEEKNGGNNEEKTNEEHKKDKQQDSEKRALPVSKIGAPEARYILLGALATVLVLVVILAGLFAARGIGIHRYQDDRGPGFGYGMMRERGYGMMNGNGYYQSNILSGKVTTVDGKNFTLDDNGTSVKVAITDSTRFPVNSSTSVKTGDTVWVWGSKNSEGVVQADRITVNP